jgi:hypothetical protein
VKIGPRIGASIGAAIGPVSSAPVEASYALEKTGGTNGGWDAQAYSTETFAATVTLEFVVDNTVGDAYSVGLSADNPDANYTGIDRGLLQDNGTMYSNENGALVSLGACAADEVWSIVRTMPGGAISYQKDSVEQAAGTALESALLVDSSFRFTGDSVSGLRVTTASGENEITWTADGITVTEE